MAHLPKVDRKKADGKPRRPRHHSIFFKLFAVLLGAVILTYVAFSGYYRADWNESNRVESHPNLIYYWELLTEKLGAPPDTVMAADISQRIGVAIGIRGPAVNWHSRNFSTFVWDDDGSGVSGKPIRMSIAKGRMWAVIPKNEYTYFFGTRRPSFLESLDSDFKGLVVMIGILWLATWLTLRRMLRPLVGLEAGVEEVETGNLEVQISEKGKDEFSALARSFNGMIRSLKARIKSNEQLLLDVSHELRSPLTRMRLALEMAPPGKPTDRLRKDLDSLEKMVAEILETGRLQEGAERLNLEPTYLRQLLAEKISAFSELGLEISCTAEPLPALSLDPAWIRVVLQNLFENILKYGRNPTRPVEASLRKDGAFAILEVRDFGQGIPEEDQPFVFEPFYQVDRSRSGAPGYGLGLGLCRRIMELHGGEIFLNSRPDEGTRITLKFPLA